MFILPLFLSSSPFLNFDQDWELCYFFIVWLGFFFQCNKSLSLWSLLQDWHRSGFAFLQTNSWEPTLLCDSLFHTRESLTLCLYVVRFIEEGGGWQVLVTDGVAVAALPKQNENTEFLRNHSSCVVYKVSTTLSTLWREAGKPGMKKSHFPCFTCCVCAESKVL